MVRTDERGAVRAKAYQELIGAMPSDGDLDGLIEELGQHRGRPILVHPVNLGRGGPSGALVSTSRADHILIDEAAAGSRRAVIILHELAHLVLGHCAQEKMADALARMIAPDLAPAVAIRYLGRDSTSNAEESDAETIAVQVAAEMRRRADGAGLDPASRLLR